MGDSFSFKSLKKGLASAMGVPEIKQKVLAATSNDQWGPTGTQMREIADATHQYNEFGLIMETIWERMNDHGKNWRHVYKSLLLLDYLLKNGADQCVREVRVKMIEIKTLQEFQHIDEKDKDVGLSVRERAKAIVELLHDERRLNEERTKARENRGKYTTAISSDDRFGGHGGGGGRSYNSRNPSGPPSYGDDFDDRSSGRYPGSSPVKPRTSAVVSSTPPSRRPQPPVGRPDLDFSDDDFDDDYDEPVPKTNPRSHATSAAPTAAKPAPAPVPLIDLLSDPAPPPVQPVTSQYPPSTAGYPQFQPQFPSNPSTAGFPATGGFPGFNPAPTATVAPATGFTFPQTGTVPPTSQPSFYPPMGGAPTGFPPAQPTQPAQPTPAFFQPTPSVQESDWSDFQAAEKKPEVEKLPAKPIDKSDPWARNDLFNFSGKDEKPASQTNVKKEPMGAVKPLSAPSPMPLGGLSTGSNPNPFGMSQPSYATPMVPSGGYVMAPQGGVPAGYMMASPGGVPAGYMMAAPGYPLGAAGRGMPPTMQSGVYGYPSG